MAAPKIPHVYEATLDEVESYRTVRLMVQLGFAVGTTIVATVKGIKSIGGDSETADEKRETARVALEEALRHGELLVESERDGDGWIVSIYVDGEPLSM